MPYCKVDAPKIYISNLMTQPEKRWLDVYQHIKAIEKQLSNFGVNTEFLTQSYLRFNLKSLHL